MPRRHIQLQVFPAHRTVAPLTWLRKVTTSALETADPSGQKGANVVIADDTTLHDLNHRFRGLDQVTDVLSFGDISAEAVAADGSGGTDEPAPEFPKPPAKEAIWGEVIISCPQAERQAGEHGWDVEHELALLVVHGVLHLVGYDHAEPEDQALMKGLEEQALARFFSATPGLPNER